MVCDDPDRSETLPRHEHLLREIVSSARLIQTRGAGRDGADFEADPALRAIIERKVAIIGDDLIRLRDEDRTLFLRIAGADGLIGLRNVITYRDDAEDEDYPAARFWHDIQRALPELLASAECTLPPGASRESGGPCPSPAVRTRDGSFGRL